MSTAGPRPSYWHWSIVSILILLFVAYYGALALRKVDALVIGVDLANADQAVWSTVHGHPFRMTTYSNMTSRLAMHLEPILLALVPLYALFPSPKTLILVQALAVALAALPLYGLAADAMGQPAWALVFPTLYLLSPATHNAVLADFHAVTLGVLPAVAALWAVWRGHTVAALLLAGVALLAREDYGLWLAALAALGWWRTRQRIWIAAAVAGLAWFLFATVVVAPLFLTKQSSPFWDRYLFWLGGPEAWQAQGFLPEKGRYLVQLLLMGGAGSLLAPLWALPALPALGLNLLSNYPLPVSLDAYYSVLVLAMLLAASAIGLSRLRPRWRKLVLLGLLLTGLWVHRTEGRSPLVPGFSPPERTAHSEALPEMLAKLPEQAPLSASPALAGHVSGRDLLRIFPQRRGAEYALVDLLQDRTLHPMSMRGRVLELLETGWGIRAGLHGLLLLENGSADTEIPASFFTFMRPERAPQYPVHVVFDGTWELQGYDVFWDYWGRPALRLYWHLLQPPGGDWQPSALALDPEGTTLTTPDTHPPVALLWLPTSFWQAGETYVVEMLPFDAPDQVTLFAGVGAPLADPTTRLRSADGPDLVPLATLERDNKGWRVRPEG